MMFSLDTLSCVCQYNVTAPFSTFKLPEGIERNNEPMTLYRHVPIAVLYVWMFLFYIKEKNKRCNLSHRECFVIVIAICDM